MGKHKAKTAIHESNLSRMTKPSQDESIGWYGVQIVIMPQKLMDVLMLGRCSHEFSWPRRAANGEYYQVCLVCTSAYQSDWKTMRPGKRVNQPMPAPTPVRRPAGNKQP